MAWQLVCDAGEGRAIPLDKAILFFGRHPECDVVITSSRKVSRKHCCIVQVNDEFVVRDLGSMNGVRVNGETVRRQTPLHLGDDLTVGDVVFHLREAPPNRRKAPRQRGAQSDQPQSLPYNISQDVPVIIPEQDQSFSVEKSVDRLPINKDGSRDAPTGDRSGSHTDDT